MYYNKFDEYHKPRANSKLTHVTFYNKVQDPNVCGLIKLTVKEWYNYLGEKMHTVHLKFTKSQ